MGSKWKVQVWGQWPECPGFYVPGANPPLCNRQVWHGDSLVRALWAMWKHRNDGTGRVTLEYRR